MLYFFIGGRRVLEASDYTFACNICLAPEPRYFVTNSACEHSACSNCFKRLALNRNNLLRACPLDRKLMTDIRYSSVNLCVIRKPTPEELELANDPEPLELEEQIQRDRAEEEAMNLEAAQRIQAQLLAGGDANQVIIVSSDEDEGNNLVWY